MNNLTRREVLALGAFTVAGLFVEGRGIGPRAAAAASGYRTLEAAWHRKTLNGLKTKLRLYNGRLPGPVVVAHPGETIRIRLKNSLTPYDSNGWSTYPNVPHHLDGTNLHVHGLDVAPHLFSPLGTTNPKARMIHVMPGESFDYAFELPSDHPSGLYWYHPHAHGSTAVQAVSGMAGALIVKGAIDEVPEIKAARDVVLAIQDIGLFPNRNEPGTWIYDPEQNAIWNTFTGKITTYNPFNGKAVAQSDLMCGFTTGDYRKRLYLVNGAPFFEETHNGATPKTAQLRPPVITMAPGEVVRFRMLNACSDNLMPIVVDGHELHLIGLDGVNFPTPRTVPVYPDSTGHGQVLLAPANRAEFLIQAGKPGRYAIRQLKQTEQFLPSDPKVIAVIQVEGPARKMALPSTLPTPSRYYPLIGNVSRRRTLMFAGRFPGKLNPYVGIDFKINGAQYDELTVQQFVTLGDAEEWVLRVGDKKHGGTEGHPFHIHVNHFEVMSVGRSKQPPGTIKDTVWIPKGSEVVIRMKFREFRGKSVYHCHILPHEDTGMMGNFLIR